MMLDWRDSVVECVRQRCRGRQASATPLSSDVTLIRCQRTLSGRRQRCRAQACNRTPRRCRELSVMPEQITTALAIPAVV